MRLWVSLTLLTALLPAGLSFALTTAKAPDDLTKVRASYRRPDSIPFPSSNPYSEAKSALGEMLFFDPLLSRSKTHSCASCHNPSLSWADGLPRAIGEDPKGLPLRAPTLIDVAFTEPLGWDGKFKDLESVAFGPIEAPANMNLPRAELVARLSAIPGYVDAFSHAFGDSAITPPRIEAALATFERSIVAGEAPFDRWIKGDETAISTSAKQGFELFNGKARCASCHNGPSFTDGSFQDIGVAKGHDIGRGVFFPTSVKLRYAFKTPTLRDVARRGPYMHDGSVGTLEQVVELYNKGGIDRPSRSPDIKPLSLTASEKNDLIAFLHTLTASPETPKVPTLPR
ncbi:tryptophan tryptophylquinone biosynthesis enzyme MauG [Bradyrhizobium macuxiense]|uniref:Methylamine utilization protein MauG n=1 Tax=Bradyrhizobium macuxiense TaxID=1755647 RepID=A0A120FGR5_9BRAD|nr:cytochrome c peroxidase [Bradyrhizobium macuxiense]KWV44777.1 tryptophan tryptophylquinone biosynthesis enzyme MauG [Bradyrhizobium macuxiense]